MERLIKPRLGVLGPLYKDIAFPTDTERDPVSLRDANEAVA